MVNKWIVIAVGAALVDVSTDAMANCFQGTWSTSDGSIWSGHNSCNAFGPNGVTWFPTWAASTDNYHVAGSDGWLTRGWNDACNLGKEFTKLWNSFYLIQNSNSWHGIEDYPFVAQGNTSGFHDEFFYKATDELGIAHFHENVFGDDEVVIECASFSSGYFADGAVRASSIVHEGWHAWQLARGVSRSHPFGKDFYYPHGVGAFAFGQMANITLASTVRARPRWSSTATCGSARSHGS